MIQEIVTDPPIDEELVNKEIPPVMNKEDTFTIIYFFKSYEIYIQVC